MYPRIKPYAVHRLEVDSPHVLHIEECGDPHGIPILFVHGGPGAGCTPIHRCFFDPELYRIILFDQRGCGRSTPHAELEGNNTDALIADIEKIREMLGIEQWILFGGSWGATLSLVYAETYSERVTGLIVRGIFLCRDKEINWLFKEGASRIYPDHWSSFIREIPEEERDNVIAAYYKRLTGENDLARMGAAKAWAKWEARTSTLQPSKSVIEHMTTPFIALSLARIEAHYFVHKGFLEDNQILNNIESITNTPTIIVQGRYDMITPLESAWDLYQALPESELDIISEAGHSASEMGTISALIRATNEFAKQFQ